ncbi:MAG: TetR/AcrR family transcriptional regulator [Chlorobi bacterium]|nr:TetR/AcrR family transcriptional regulator [Chlorobiota bacterium]
MKDKTRRKQEIIEAASFVFSRFGYKKTTIEDIAGQLHMRKSSLYYYFGGKDEIFQRVVEYEANKVRYQLVHTLEQHEDPRSRLRHYIIRRMETLREISRRYSVIYDDDLIHYDFIEQIRRKYDREEHNTIRKILEEGVQAGVFHVRNPSLAATAICTAMKGLEIPLFWKKKQAFADTHVDNMIHLLFYGLVRRIQPTPDTGK